MQFFKVLSKTTKLLNWAKSTRKCKGKMTISLFITFFINFESLLSHCLKILSFSKGIWALALFNWDIFLWEGILLLQRATIWSSRRKLHFLNITKFKIANLLGGRNFDAPKEFLHLAKTNFNVKQMRIMQHSDKCSQIVFDLYDGEHVKFVCAYNRLQKSSLFFSLHFSSY